MYLAAKLGVGWFRQPWCRHCAMGTKVPSHTFGPLTCGKLQHCRHRFVVAGGNALCRPVRPKLGLPVGQVAAHQHPVTPGG
jgi:hypothetical protein